MGRLASLLLLLMVLLGIALMHGASPASASGLHHLAPPPAVVATDGDATTGDDNAAAQGDDAASSGHTGAEHGLLMTGCVFVLTGILALGLAQFLRRRRGIGVAVPLSRGLPPGVVRFLLTGSRPLVPFSLCVLRI
ncbi:hypothetical protein GCM10022262_40530 [Georgenia daeguensis]|uniref:LPXTG cell wall anchor domain-containing protein n=1 Tax=Georgenia daeguensis TaxID=908355 RepID=A0ABP6UM23_9MICO